MNNPISGVNIAFVGFFIYIWIDSVMKFYSLLNASDRPDLSGEYAQARRIGNLAVGSEHLFFRYRLKTFFVPYADIRRCYRRVLLVPATMCCGKGELQAENLVLHNETGEFAQIPLPDTRAAREIMRLLKERIPGAVFSSPEKEAQAEQK